ncbi:MAG: MAPEG family protein [Deltaproteobacteria bacterium]|nr:MAPEG family protein [Deltaproteobacteria bacterium]
MPTTDLAALRGPITVTALYFALWYGLLFGLQVRTKYRLRREYAERGQVFDRYHGNDPAMLFADRAVQNTHEQMVPFLLGLWLYAIFVSASVATGLGAAYVALRAVYPLLLGPRIEQVQSRRVAFVTFPCYAIIFWMLGASVAKAWGGLG